VKVQHRWKLEIFNRQGSIHENSTTHQGINGNPNGFTGKSADTRNKDLTQGTCFVCHKKGCRAKFHEDNRQVPQSNNASAAEAEENYEISDQEK
jgi:hypothetical protein